MEKQDFNTGWTFERLGTDTPACRVDLPHDAMLGEPRREDCPGGTNTGWFEGHDYRYSKTLTLTESQAGQTVLLEFEGVYHNAVVEVNGTRVAGRPYGYSNFTADLTGRVRAGANTVTVTARNADQPNSRWYSGAGIYRPVWLYLAPAEHIRLDGVRVQTLGLEPPRAGFSICTTAPGWLTVTVTDTAGKTLAVESRPTPGNTRFPLDLPQAPLWSCEAPNLCRCTVEFSREEGGAVLDRSQVTFGLRTLRWDTRQGLCLNGSRVILRGACIHHDNGLLGACCYPDAEERKVALLRKTGYNALRSAHNPCSKALLDACDRLGMLVMDEFVDCWYIHKTKNDYVEVFEDWWQQDLADMVAKDYNHPCVILYSTGNEVSETAQPRGIELTGRMTRWLHQLDDTRPVTCGVNIFFNLLSSLGFGVYSDEKADAQARTGKKKAVGSEFYNTLAGLLGDKAMKLGATLHGCDVKTRDAYANMDIAGYNYGILRYRHDLKKYPQRLILGTETFCNDAYRFWELARTEPRILGDFVWAGMDYLGEVGVGSWEYADYAPRFDGGPGWISAGSGRLDLTGLPLSEADYTRVAFEIEHGPRLAVRPPCHTGKHSPSAWKMTNARRSWSWPGCTGRRTVVEVYARAAAVEVFLNGKSCGKRRLPANDCKVLYRIPYADGELSAVSYDGAGRTLGRDALCTAGTDTCLRIRPEQTTAAPGGLVYLHLQYTDGEGIEKPMERHRIRVTVRGGRLLALGHACPYNGEGYLGTETDTYYGRALAIVQADGSGPVELTADDGIHTAHGTVPLGDGAGNP